MSKLQEMLDIWQGVLRMGGWCIRARRMGQGECGTWRDDDTKMALIKLPEPDAENDQTERMLVFELMGVKMGVTCQDATDRLAAIDDLSQALFDIKDAAQTEINDLYKKIREAKLREADAELKAENYRQKAIEATARENHYKEQVDKRWASIYDYSQAVADEILDIITAAGNTTPELIEKLRVRFGNKGVKHGQV